MYLSTASTVLVLVIAILLSAVLGLVLAILLNAVHVLVHVFDHQSTWTWQVLSQVLFMFSLNIWLSQELGKMTLCLLLFFFLTKRHDMKHKWCKKITAMKITVCLLLFCTHHHDMKHK